MAANHTKLIGLGRGCDFSNLPLRRWRMQWLVTRSADTLSGGTETSSKSSAARQAQSQTYCKIVELNDQIDEKEDPIKTLES